MALAASELAVLRRMNIFVPANNSDPKGNGTGPGEDAGGFIQTSASGNLLHSGGKSGKHIYRTDVAGWREAMLDDLKAQNTEAVGNGLGSPVFVATVATTAALGGWDQNA